LPEARQRNKVVVNLAWSLTSATAAIVALVALVYLRDPAFQAGHGAEGDLGLAALNAVPPALFALLVLALTRRPLLAFWSAALLTFLLYTINDLKLASLATPLLPGDFAMLRQVDAGHGLLYHYVPTARTDLENYVLVLLATIAAIAIPLRLSMRLWPRVASAIVLVAASASLIAGTPAWPALYSNERFDFQPWAPTFSADHAGLIASLLRYHWDVSATLDEPDRDGARALVVRHGDALDVSAAPAPPAGELPDIIVLQSESFFDAARLQGLEPDQIAPALRRLDAQATHGDLWVPTYGGGTIRTEFEVLTGIGMRYFPQVQYPYYEMATRALPTLADVLSARGYRTLAVHPNDPVFWNRATAFKAMGFDRFDDESQFGDAPREGFFVSDEALVDHILQRLDDDGPPAFIFAISMENHGPYDNSPGIDERRRDTEPVPPGTPPEAAAELRDYLYHLHNADRSLGRLADALGRRKRRSLLLFYGDHLPALTKTYQSTGFDDTNMPTGQPVPYLLLDTADRSEHVQDSASFFLPAQLLAAAGIHDRYFDVLDRVRDETAFGPGYVPAEDADLGALMRMRQAGEWPDLLLAAPASPETANAGPAP